MINAKKGFRYGISIATEPLAESMPIVYRGDLRKIAEDCRALGYDGIELQLRDPQKIDAGQVLALCKETGLKITAIATALENLLNGLSMIDDDVSRRMQMRETLKKHILLGERLECPVIIGCVRGNIPPGGDPEMYLERFREEILIAADFAAEHHVTLVLEAINYYVNNYLNSIIETCDFIDGLNRPNVKLHIDTHHMAIEERDMAYSIRYAGKRIGYVHFSDNDRMYPGACGVDYVTVMRELQAVDYSGFIVFEIVPRPTADICAERGLRYCKLVEELLTFQV